MATALDIARSIKGLTPKATNQFALAIKAEQDGEKGKADERLAKALEHEAKGE